MFPFADHRRENKSINKGCHHIAFVVYTFLRLTKHREIRNSHLSLSNMCMSTFLSQLI